MRPNDDFFYERGLAVSYDNKSLSQLYQPIIGLDALCLYGYLSAFWDNGIERHKFSEILNHLQFGMQRFEEALAVLTAMDLVAFYQKSEGYLIALKPALTATVFFANPAYRRLLEKKIGDVAAARLMVKEPEAVRELSKKFSDVFSDSGDVEIHPAPAVTFDLESFQKRMVHDGLRFDDEKEDVIALYKMAERYQLTWYDLYQLAKETAHQHVIHTKRMLAKKEQVAVTVGVSAFSEQEQVLLQQAKTEKPEVVLAQIKKGRRATITADELKLLEELVQMTFLDEVINVMVIYTMAKTKSANLNRNYVMKIANDFAYQKVSSAEVAIEKMRSFDQRKNSQKAPKQPVSNVPEWSQEHYKNETTQDEQERLEEIKRQTLAKLGRGN